MSDYIDKVNIEGTDYEIQDTPTKEQAEENTQDISEMKASQNYSIEEHLTGRKWVDGKDIYQLTVANFTGINKGAKAVATLPSGMDTLCHLYGARRIPSQPPISWAPLPQVSDQSKIYDVGLDIYGTTLRLLSSGVDSSQWICNATIEYTKTN